MKPAPEKKTVILWPVLAIILSLSSAMKLVSLSPKMIFSRIENIIVPTMVKV